MRKFVHPSHTVWELRPWSKEKCGYVLVKMTGQRIRFPSLFHKENIRLYYYRPNEHQRFVFIRLPIFYFKVDNCNIHIGLPNRYLWIIK